MLYLRGGRRSRILGCGGWGRCLSQQLRGPAATAKAFVDEAIAKNNVVILSKSYCHFCKKAKEIFDDLDVSYPAVELDNRSDGDDIQRELCEMTGANTVPRVFVKKQCLGGADDVQDMKNKKPLQALLASHGLLKKK